MKSPSAIYYYKRCMSFSLTPYLPLANECRSKRRLYSRIQSRCKARPPWGKPKGDTFHSPPRHATHIPNDTVEIFLYRHSSHLTMFDITSIFETHGIWFSLVSQGFTLLAWIFAIATLRNCNYMTVTVGEDNEDEEFVYGIGLIRYRTITTRRTFGTTTRSTSYCTRYSEDDVNFDIYYVDHPLWKLGVAMSSLTILLGIILLFFALSTSCISYNNLRIFSIFFYLSVICFIIQTLIFLVWANDKLCDKTNNHQVCKFGKGTATNIFASCLWLWVANMIKSFPEYLPPRRTARTTEAEGVEDRNDDESPNPPSPSPSSSPTRRTRGNNATSAAATDTDRPQSQRRLPPPPPSSPKKKKKPSSQRRRQQGQQQRKPNASRPKSKQTTQNKRSGTNPNDKK